MRADDSRGHWLSSRDQAQRLERDDERARSAITLIQQGRFQEAGVVLSDLRTQYGAGNVPRMMIRILLIEACMKYYQDRSPQALDRARRALALSSASEFVDLESEAATWYALYCFNFDKYTEFGQALTTAFQGFDQLTDALRARFCVLIADSLQFFGDFQTSDKWYLCARVLSRRAGDRPLMAAIEYNRLVMALSFLRLARFIGADRNIASHRNWIEEILSMQRLHEGLNIDALDQLLLLADCLARQACNDYLGSAATLERIRAQDAAQVCGLSSRQLDLEILWSNVLGGKVESSIELDLPSFEQLGQWSYAEQITGIRQLAEVYHILNIPCDEGVIQEMHLTAVNHCKDADRELRIATEACRDMLATIEFTVFGR